MWWQSQPAAQAGLLCRLEFSTCPSFLQKQNQQLLTLDGPLTINKKMHFSFSLSRPISPLYLRDRLTSAQKLPRNEADKEALLWLFSRVHFFLPLLPLGLVKLVWAAYQGPREPHQSAWISCVVFGVCGVVVRRLLPPPMCSDHLHAYGAAPQQATHAARGSRGE